VSDYIQFSKCGASISKKKTFEIKCTLKKEKKKERKYKEKNKKKERKEKYTY